MGSRGPSSIGASSSRASNRKTFVTLHTTERMRTAQQMYEAMGFRRLDDRVFPDGFVLLTYRIEL